MTAEDRLLTDARVLRVMRWAIAVLLLAAFAATFTELLLLAHVEDPWQLAPLVLLGVGAAILVWTLVRPGALAVRLFQALMIAFLAAAGVGMALHYRTNVEFQREMDPALAGRALFWKAVAAKTPPALAPAILAQLGLVGLIYTYGHPALGAARRRQKEEVA